MHTKYKQHRKQQTLFSSSTSTQKPENPINDHISIWYQQKKT